MEQSSGESRLFCVYLEFKFLKRIICHIEVKCFRAWETKFKVFKDTKASSVSGFSFWAIEPIWAEGNDGEIKKSPFSGKLMNGVSSSWLKYGHWSEKVPKSCIWTKKNYLVQNKEPHLSNSLGKVGYFGFIWNSNS